MCEWPGSLLTAPTSLRQHPPSLFLWTSPSMALLSAGRSSHEFYPISLGKPSLGTHTVRCYVGPGAGASGRGRCANLCVYHGRATPSNEMIPQTKACSCLPSRKNSHSVFLAICWTWLRTSLKSPKSSISRTRVFPKPAPKAVFPGVQTSAGPIQVWAANPPGTGPAQPELEPARACPDG